MLSRLPLVAVLAILGCLSSLARGEAPRIEVEALFKDAAVIKIDGQRKTLRAGQSYGGVTLLSAYSRTATLEINGQQSVVGISRRIGANYQAPAEQVVTIERNDMLQYRTQARINGRSVGVMVDTGANVVAMSQQHARSMGIDFRSGTPAKVETAGGIIDAWVVTLRSVEVGGIRVENVRASVVDGGFPATVLLGMSFLRHVDMRESNDTLSLSRAW